MSRRARVLVEHARATKERDTSTWAEKLRLVVDGCHPKQRQFVLDDGLWISALIARGGGKTTGGRARLLRRLMSIFRARCLYIAKTRDQASELMWNQLKDLLERLEISARFNETKLKCTLTKNGSTLKLVGADDKREIDKLRGQPFHEVQIDEAASFPRELLDALIDRIIEPRLGDFGGSLVMYGTPGHLLQGRFWEVTRQGSKMMRRWDERDLPEFEGWKGWSHHSWTLQDGAETVPAMARLWERALDKKAFNQWSDDHPIWLREHMGQWAADDTENVFKYRPFVDGQPWNQWDPPRHGPYRFGKLPDRPDWHYAYGLDMGHSDPFALVIYAFSPSDPDRNIYQIYGFSKREMYAKTIAELLIGEKLDASKPDGLIGQTGWPTILVADTAGLGDAMLDELAKVYGIPIVAAEKKNKFASIELTNGDLVDGRIKVLKGGELESQMMELQWVTDEYGKLKENKAQPNHSSDASIYARRHIAKFFQEEQPAAPARPQPLDPFRDGRPSDDEWRGESDDLLGDYRYDAR